MNETGTSRVKERKSELTCASHRILRLWVNPELMLSARSAFPRGMEFPIGIVVLSSIVQEHQEETEASLLAQRAVPNSSKKNCLEDLTTPFPSQYLFLPVGKVYKKFLLYFL